MLSFDIKQMMDWRRWILPLLLFTIMIMLSRIDVLKEMLVVKKEVESGGTLKFLIESLKSDTALLILPILCTFPYATSFIDEIHSGMLKNVLVRVKKSQYIFSKCVSCLYSGGLEVLSSILLFCIINWLLLSHLEVPVAADRATDLLAEQLLMQRELIELVIRYVCLGSLASIVGLLLSLVTMNRFMTWIGPFIVDYLFIIVYERYFDKIKLFYPKEWFLHNLKWPLDNIGLCLWLIFLAIFVSLIVLYYGEKVLKDVL